MRDDTEAGVDADSRIVRVGWEEGEHVLYDEEEKWDHDAYLGPGEEDLNEKVLDDKYYIEEDENYERDVEGYVC